MSQEKPDKNNLEFKTKSWVYPIVYRGLGRCTDGKSAPGLSWNVLLIGDIWGRGDRDAGISQFVVLRWGPIFPRTWETTMRGLNAANACFPDKPQMSTTLIPYH